MRLRQISLEAGPDALPHILKNHALRFFSRNLYYKISSKYDKRFRSSQTLWIYGQDSCWFLVGFNHRYWRWKRHVPPK
jgi:hypothetical protein